MALWRCVWFFVPLVFAIPRTRTGGYKMIVQTQPGTTVAAPRTSYAITHIDFKRFLWNDGCGKMNPDSGDTGADGLFVELKTDDHNTIVDVGGEQLGDRNVLQDDFVLQLSAWYMNVMGLQEGQEVVVLPMRKVPVATKIQLQPQKYQLFEEEVTDFDEAKALLQTQLADKFSTLGVGDTVTLETASGKQFDLTVTELEPQSPRAEVAEYTPVTNPTETWRFARPYENDGAIRKAESGGYTSPESRPATQIWRSVVSTYVCTQTAGGASVEIDFKAAANTARKEIDEQDACLAALLDNTFTLPKPEDGQKGQLGGKGKGRPLLAIMRPGHELYGGPPRLAKYNKGNTDAITFDDIVGLEEAKDRLRREVLGLAAVDQRQRWSEVDFNSAVYSQFFFGPMGTGKTMLGKALAMELATVFEQPVTVFIVNPLFLGKGGTFGKGYNSAELQSVDKSMKQIFTCARMNSPSVIMFEDGAGLLKRDPEQKVVAHSDLAMYVKDAALRFNGVEPSYGKGKGKEFVLPIFTQRWAGDGVDEAKREPLPELDGYWLKYVPHRTYTARPNRLERAELLRRYCDEQKPKVLFPVDWPLTPLTDASEDPTCSERLAERIAGFVPLDIRSLVRGLWGQVADLRIPRARALEEAARLVRKAARKVRKAARKVRKAAGHAWAARKARKAARKAATQDKNDLNEDTAATQDKSDLNEDSDFDDDSDDEEWGDGDKDDWGEAEAVDEFGGGGGWDSLLEFAHAETDWSDSASMLEAMGVESIEPKMEDWTRALALIPHPDVSLRAPLETARMYAPESCQAGLAALEAETEVKKAWPAAKKQGLSSCFPTSDEEEVKQIEPDACMDELKSKYTVVMNPTTPFSDIVGTHTAKEVLNKKVVLPVVLQSVTGEKSKKTGNPGAIFFGPPGTGKTLIAKGLATELKIALEKQATPVTFIAVAPAQIRSKYAGEAESNIQFLYSCARKVSPSVIFFDEGDSLFKARAQNGGQGDAAGEGGIRSQLLQELDGMVSEEHTDAIVVTLIATNRIDDMDRAFFRRLPEKVYFPLPSRDERVELVDFYAGRNGLEWPKAFMQTFDPAEPTCPTLLADRLDGYSPSDIANLMGAVARAEVPDTTLDLEGSVAEQLAGKTMEELSELQAAMEGGDSTEVTKDALLGALKLVGKSGSESDVAEYRDQARTHAKAALAKQDAREEREAKEKEQWPDSSRERWQKQCMPGADDEVELEEQDGCLTELEEDFDVVRNPSVPFKSIVGGRTTKSLLQRNIILNVYRRAVSGKAPDAGKLGGIFFGPPGTGKTLMAKGLATELQAALAATAARVTFIAVQPSQITSKFVGEAEEKVKKLYACARKVSPSVIFFDEGDMLFASRGKGAASHETALRAQLLQELDGMGTGQAIVVTLVATNRITAIDNAFQRRLPKRIYFPMPLRKDREGLIAFYAEKNGLTLPAGFEEAGPNGGPSCLAMAAQSLPKWSSSDIANLLDQAGAIVKAASVKEAFGGDLAFGADDFSANLASLSSEDKTKLLESSAPAAGDNTELTRKVWGESRKVIKRSDVDLETYEEQARMFAESALDEHNAMQESEAAERESWPANARDRFNNECFTDAQDEDEEEQAPIMEDADPCLGPLESKFTVVRDAGVRFGDIIGAQTAKTLLNRNIVLNVWRRARSGKNAKMGKMGGIFFGPPGTGKTLMAKALATELRQVLQKTPTQVTFIAVQPSQVTSKFVGEAEQNIKMLYECARKVSPAVIFFDEGDSLFSKRGGGGGGGSDKIRSEMLQQLDGFASGGNKIVVTLIATNRIDDLDGAFFRRLPYKIYFPLPLRQDRANLLQFYATKAGLQLPAAFATKPFPAGSPASATCAARIAATMRYWSPSNVANLASSLAQTVKGRVLSAAMESSSDAGNTSKFDFTSNTFSDKLAHLPADNQTKVLDSFKKGGAQAAFIVTRADWVTARTSISPTIHQHELKTYESQAATHADKALKEYKAREKAELAEVEAWPGPNDDESLYACFPDPTGAVRTSPKSAKNAAIPTLQSDEDDDDIYASLVEQPRMAHIFRSEPAP